MRIVYSRTDRARFVNFEFMNRQLVWHGFTEFLLFLMPLINIGKIKTAITKFFSKTGGRNAEQEGVCGICMEAKVMTQTPVLTNCKHIFCYYCTKSKLMTTSNYSCPICGQTITSIKRLSKQHLQQTTQNQTQQ